MFEELRLGLEIAYLGTKTNLRQPALREGGPIFYFLNSSSDAGLRLDQKTIIMKKITVA